MRRLDNKKMIIGTVVSLSMAALISVGVYANSEETSGTEKSKIVQTMKYEVKKISKAVPVVGDKYIDERPIEQIVEEDYMSQVSGFKDWVIEAGAQINFLKDIVVSDCVSVEVDATGLNTTTPGNYEISYKIKRNDDKLIVSKKVSVKVVSAGDAQSMANNGEVVYISGNAVKEKYVPVVNNNAESSSVNNNDATPEEPEVLGGLKVGESYYYGEPIDWGYIDGPNGNTWNDMGRIFTDQYGNVLSRQQVVEALRKTGLYTEEEIEIIVSRINNRDESLNK